MTGERGWGKQLPTREDLYLRRLCLETITTPKKGPRVISQNVINCMLHIRRANKTGSAFTIERGGKQYLVTARHVVEGIASGESIFIVHEKQWQTVDINVVGVGEGEVDVAVLAGQQQLSPTPSLEPDATMFFYGQQAYFLGFPFGWDSGGERSNNGRPIPFAKAGIISAFLSEDAPAVQKIYLDAHANEGFSGGPVVFPRLDKQKELRVVGVVVGYPKSFQPVVDDNGNTVAHAQENPGLVLAINISHVVALIDANPIGFALPGQTSGSA